MDSSSAYKAPKFYSGRIAKVVEHVTGMPQKSSPKIDKLRSLDRPHKEPFIVNFTM